MMLPTKDIIIVAFLCGISILFIGAGIYGRNKLLSPPNNACKMTYSPRSFTYKPIAIPYHSSYKLLKYEAKQAKSTHLNPYPVLFIPGSIGAFDQVRSIASTIMHNKKQLFQYFTIDFKGSVSALHAAYILDQAAFVNEAIRAIFQLYTKNTDQAAPKKIILIGHSLGGMVARTSILLSNHPRCQVSTLLLLSVPTLQPPFPCDTSLSNLYSKVNTAYMNSYYNDSKACKSAYEKWIVSKESETTDTVSELPPIDKLNISIGINWECSVCVPTLRMISITGGEIDELIRPENTYLDTFGPIPVNTTALRVKKPTSSLLSSLDLFSQIKSIVHMIQYVGYKVHFYFHPMNTPQPTQATANKTCPNSNTTVESSANVECNTTNTASAIDSTKHNKKVQTLEDISDDNWSEHMRAFHPPQHLHLRTSQFKSIGYLVDHQAMVWCHQVLHALVQGMEKIVSADNEQQETLELISLFPIKKEYQFKYNQQTNAQVKYLMQRKHTTAMHTRARAQDILGMHVILQNKFLTVATLFVTSTPTWMHILTYFLSLYCLDLIRYYVTFLSGLEMPPSTVWSSITPNRHFLLDLLFPPIAHLICHVFGYSNALILHKFIPGLLASLFLYIVYLMVAGSSKVTLTPATFVGIAYCGALTLKLLLLCVISLLQYTINQILYILNICLRFTIWRKTTRKIFRKSLQKITSTYLTPIGNFLTAYAVTASVLLITIIVKLFGPSNTQMSTISYFGNIYLLAVYVLVFLGYCANLLFPINSTPYMTHKQLEVALYYWPILFTCFPTVTLAATSVFQTAHTSIDTSRSLEALGTFRWECMLLLTFIWFYFLSVRNEEIPIVSSLICVDVFGPHHQKELQKLSFVYQQQRQYQALRDNNRSTSGNSSSKSVTSSGILRDCVHEDGGKRAVYQQYYSEEDIPSNAPVSIAKVKYIVQYCSCHVDKSLNHVYEYCEFCRCRNCGSKYIDEDVSSSWQSSIEKWGQSINVDVFLTLFFLLLAIWNVLYTEDKLYSYTYLLGSIAGAQVLRNWGIRVGIFKR